MGKPTAGNTAVSCAESIGAGGEPGEVKHLSTGGKKTISDSVSSGERKRNSLNRADASPPGVAGRTGMTREKSYR